MRQRTAVLVAVLLAAWMAGPSAVPATSPLEEDEVIVHVLNRLGFCPRAGDVERVRALGLKAYIDQQLRLDRIPDSGVAERLAGFRTLGLTSRDIAAQYELPLLRARRQQRQQPGGRVGASGDGQGPGGTGQGADGTGQSVGGTGQSVAGTRPNARGLPHRL